jgi:hypothetical protein
MKRSILFILLFCLLVPLAQAQLWKVRRFEVVAGIGPSVFFGDIGGFTKSKNILGLRDFSFLQTRYDFNLNLKYRITRDVNIRLGLLSGSLQATDERGSNIARGFEASTSIFEPSLIGEYYLIKNDVENSYIFAKGEKGLIGGLMGSLDIYVFTGLGGVSYSVSPNAKLNTEILSKSGKTSGFACVIPIGAGAALAFSPNFNFGLEFAGRYAFTDNLDGYSSQYSSSNDVYYFLNATITYKLKTNANGFPTFR